MPQPPADASAMPVRLDLQKTSHLEIQWRDGTTSRYPLAYLRCQCPCAGCRALRSEQKKSRLTVLPAGWKGDAPTVLEAELVGNYALRLVWSDQHDTGIYSFTYLREISPTGP